MIHQLKHHDHPQADRTWQSSHQKTSVTRWYNHGTTSSSYGSFSTPGQILGVGVPSNSQVRTSWCSCHPDPASLGFAWNNMTENVPMESTESTVQHLSLQNWGFPAKFARESPDRRHFVKVSESYSDCRALVAKHCYQSESKFYLFHISSMLKKGSGIPSGKLT